MENAALSPTVFEYLVKHLVEIEDGRTRLLEQYYQEPTRERHDFEDMIDTYIMHVDTLIKNANKTQSVGSMIPFVTIDSEVEVLDLDDQETYAYHIVSPFNGRVRPERGFISYLSPIGRMLLLKKAGDEVQIKTPGGVIRYRILSICMPGEPESVS